METIYYVRIDGKRLTAERDFVLMAQRLGYQAIKFTGFENDSTEMRENCQRIAKTMRALGFRSIDMTHGDEIHVHTMTRELCEIRHPEKK